MNPGIRGLWLGIALSVCLGNTFAETIPLDCRVDAFIGLKGSEGRWTPVTGEGSKIKRFVLVLDNGLISKESVARIDNLDTQPGEPILCAKSQNQHLNCQDNFHGITVDFSEETQLGVIARYGEGAKNKDGQVISLRPFSCTRE
jgi:hypothetical protein